MEDHNWAIIRKHPMGGPVFLTESGKWTRDRMQALTSGRKVFIEDICRQRFQKGGPAVVDLNQPIT